MWVVVAIVCGLGVGVALRYYFAQRLAADVVAQAQHRAGEVVAAQKRRARQLLEQAILESDTEFESAREALSTYANDRSQEFAVLEGSLRAREEIVNARDQRLKQWQKELKSREDEMAKREALAAASRTQIERAQQDRQQALARAAGVTPEILAAERVQSLVETFSRSLQMSLRDDLEAVKQEAEKRAKRVIDIAVQRYESRFYMPKPNFALDVTTEESKVAIEAAAETIAKAAEDYKVELNANDDGTRLIVGSQDYLRREMFRRAMVAWLAEPKPTEKSFPRALDAATRDVERECAVAATDLVKVMRIDPLPKKVAETAGKLRFRASYSQNQWCHAVEVGSLASLIAAELGVEQTLSRRGGTLHDIGKAIDHEVEGPHAVIGATICREAGENEMMCNAIGSHHNDEPPLSPMAYVVTAADSASGGRPGARHEQTDSYFERVKEVERIPSTFRGVTKVYALQAGREVRVFVDPRRVSDRDCAGLSQQIARRIEKELVYPGQIQVVVIRETQTHHVAA